MEKMSLTATRYLLRVFGEDWGEAKRDGTAAERQSDSWAVSLRGVNLYYINM
jgi:hypothetical protein